MRLSLPLALCASLLAPSSYAQGSLSDRVPETASFYLDVNDVPAFAQGMSSSAMGEIWRDQRVQDFVAGLLPMIDSGMSQAEAMLATQGLPASVLEPAAYGRLEIAGGLQSIMSAGPGSPPAGFFAIRIGFRNRDLADGYWQLLSGAMKSQGAQGDPDSGSLHLVSDPDFDIDLSREGDAIDFWIGNVARPEDGSSLASSGAFQEERKALPQRSVFLYADFGKLMKAVEPAMAHLPTGEAAKLRALFHTIGLDSLGAFTVSSGWEDGDSVADMAMGFGPDGPQGFFGDLLSDGVADSSLVRYIPAKATKFSISNASFRTFSQTLDQLLDQFLAIAAEKGQGIEESHPAYAWLQGDKRAVLDKALNSLGPDSFSYAMVDASSMMSGSNAAAFLRVRDVEDARPAFHEMMSFLSTLLDPVEEVSLLVKTVKLRVKGEDGKWVTHDGPEYYVLRLNPSILPPQAAQASMVLAQFQPSFGVSDDGWLAFSMNPSTVRKTLRDGVKEPEKNISSNPEAAAFLTSAPKRARMLAWSDPRPAAEGAVTMMQGLIPMISMQVPTEQLPVDLDKFPGPEAITSHLRTSEAYALVENGRLHTHMIGSFGLNEIFALSAIAGAGTGAFTLRSREGMPEPEEDGAVITTENVGTPPSPDQHSTTMKELQRLQSGLLIYQMEKDEYPATLQDLLAPVEGWPDGILQDPSRGIVPDGWGHDFLYKRTDDGSFLLYSAGPDGKDDGGSGDDVSLG